MSSTPRTPRSRAPSRVPSRVPSRSGTPVPGRSPSRLASRSAVPPMPSVSNLRVYSYGASTSATHPPDSPSGPPEPGDTSSGSSMVEGILVQEQDADVDIIDGEQGSAAGLVQSPAGNEESKKSLREQLRRTLSKKESFGGERRRASSVVEFPCIKSSQTYQPSGDGIARPHHLCRRSCLHQVSLWSFNLIHLYSRQAASKRSTTYPDSTSS